ncbi:MAG: PAS domain-containing protein [Chitinophagaceae bacterium]|nr:PAS domain-containing protein [Chitinophagaceae bacterium]
MNHIPIQPSFTSHPGLNNEKIRSLVNHIPGAIYRCRGDKFITLEFFSDEIEKLTGYPVNYFMQNTKDGYSKLVYADDRDAFTELIRCAIADKIKYEIEYRIVTKNGELKWVFESGKGNYDEDEKVVFVDGCIFDITRCKQAEAALAITKDEVRRLALVARNTTNAVMITDSEENIIWINESYTRISGYTLEEIAGKKIGYSLDGPGGDPDIRQKVHKLLDNKQPYKDELMSFHKNGNPIWVEVDCQPMRDEQGKYLGYMAIETDITQRKQILKEQEELLQRLSLATGSAAIGIFEMDFANKQVIWDDRMYEIYGCKKEEGLNLFKVFNKAIHPEEQAMITKIIEESRAQKKDINGIVYRIIIPDGRIRYIESHAIIKKSESGLIDSLIGTNRDITDAVLAQEKLKAQNKVLRDIAFIQSHEVRRPLANILGVLEILQNSGALKGLELFDHLIESAKELDVQIRAIVTKANEMDDEVFR